MARQALADGDIATARMLFQQVLEEEPGNVPALAGRAMIQVQTGELSEAHALIARIPLSRWSDPDVAATRQALTERTRKGS